MFPGALRQALSTSISLENTDEGHFLTINNFDHLFQINYSFIWVSLLTATLVSLHTYRAPYMWNLRHHMRGNKISPLLCGMFRNQSAVIRVRNNAQRGELFKECNQWRCAAIGFQYKHVQYILLLLLPQQFSSNNILDKKDWLKWCTFGIQLKKQIIYCYK